ncbi:MAG: hypothetical protein KAR21_22830 [Spirochaetales bacterium]|nr:hypothetical protein [Spirochaetales bacterium]
MKKLILVGIIILMVIPGAFAQFRIDLAIDVPRGAGSSSNTDDEFVDALSDFLNEYIIPVPEASFVYQYSFDSIPLHVGGGIRAFSFILESVAWPIVYAELDLSPIVIHSNIGGLGFLSFGLFNDVATRNLIIPDLHIAYKFGKTFRLGLGAIGFTGSDTNETLYAVYLTGRFSILFDKDK